MRFLRFLRRRWAAHVERVKMRRWEYASRGSDAGTGAAYADPTWYETDLIVGPEIAERVSGVETRPGPHDGPTPV